LLNGRAADAYTPEAPTPGKTLDERLNTIWSKLDDKTKTQASDIVLVLDFATDITPQMVLDYIQTKADNGQALASLSRLYIVKDGTLTFVEQPPTKFNTPVYGYVQLGKDGTIVKYYRNGTNTDIG
jgi:hypothetical protein